MYDATIIGGGASGLAAAITLKRTNSKLSVAILEKLSNPGKKILATGNGRCNLSNTNISSRQYFGDEKIIELILRSFGTDDCTNFFESLGLITTVEDERIYPLSMSASSVLSVLIEECKRLNIDIITDSKVTSINNISTLKNTLENSNKYFEIITENGHYESRTCILAIGGKASAQNGTDGDGYKLLKVFGIKYENISPALVQIKTKEPFTHTLKGVRVRGSIKLSISNDESQIKEYGEILFTDYGLSGIAVMQLSGRIAKQVQNKISPKIILDLCPSMTEESLSKLIAERLNLGISLDKILEGILPEKMANAIAKLSSSNDGHSGNNSNIELGIITAKLIKNLTLTATGTNSYKDAQVTQGGVPAYELKNKSLQANKVPGLFICGELLNVDGLCGGYNLHFAWGSGIFAAKEAAEFAKN